MLKEVKIGNTINEVIDFTLETCCSCSIPFFMPTYLHKRLVADKGERFFCPNGHGMTFIGKTEAEKLKEQLEKLQQEKDRQHELLQNKWLDAIGEKYKLEKQLKKVHKGICPCCNRSFQNLKNHMETKHPELVAKLIINPIDKSINNRSGKTKLKTNN